MEAVAQKTRAGRTLTRRNASSRESRLIGPVIDEVIMMRG